MMAPRSSQIEASEDFAGVLYADPCGYRLAVSARAASYIIQRRGPDGLWLRVRAFSSAEWVADWLMVNDFDSADWGAVLEGLPDQPGALPKPFSAGGALDAPSAL